MTAATPSMPARARAALGWAPEQDFTSGLETTVLWYLDNADWVRDVDLRRLSRLGRRALRVKLLRPRSATGRWDVRCKLRWPRWGTSSRSGTARSISVCRRASVPLSTARSPTSSSTLPLTRRSTTPRTIARGRGGSTARPSGRSARPPKRTTLWSFTTRPIMSIAGVGTDCQSESDPTSPTSVYAASKLAGEMLLRESGADTIILRTSWVYASAGKNFPLTILRLAKEREALNVVADQIGAPTPADLIAAVTARIIPQARGLLGTYNLAPTGETSWHGLARLLVAQAIAAGAKLKLTPEAIAPIPASQYPAKASRPANSRLDTSKLRSSFGVQLPPWQDGIRQLITTLATEGRL